MTTILTGVFDDIAQAKQACSMLKLQGLDDSAVTLVATDVDNTRTAEPRDRRGFFATFFGLSEPDEASGHYAEAVRRGGAVITVRLADDNRADDVTDLLERAGAIDTTERVEQWKANGYAGHDANAAPYTAAQKAKELETLKVVQEEVKVGKREVMHGGVRVQRRVIETPVREQISLHEERAVVERHPVNRVATPADLAAFGQGDQQLEIRNTAEEAVVSKTARVVEEVTVGKQARDRVDTIVDSVRRTDVDVQEIPDPRGPVVRDNQQRPGSSR